MSDRIFAEHNRSNLELTLWEQRRSVLQHGVNDPKGVHHSVNPDALFALTDRNKPTSANTIYYFLEVVKSRESDHLKHESYFVRKMRGFLECKRQDKQRKKFGIPNFLVLTVVPTPREGIESQSQAR